jgi:ribosomal protein L29
MKRSNYQNKSKQDLIKALGEKREALRKLRFGSTGSKTRNVKERSSARKDAARIMTALTSIRRNELNKIK